MKRNFPFNFTLSVLMPLFIFLQNNALAQPSYYAPVPFYDGFESGVLDSNWYKTSSMPQGRIKIWPSDSLTWGGDTAYSVAGTKFLGMDMPQGGTMNLNEAWLGLNTAGSGSLRLSFWWSDWNDETSLEDGIYISNDGGVTFTKVLDLLGDSNTDLNWVYFNFNLDSINQVHGLTYTTNYIIKFQQFDNYYFAGGNDGFMFDEIYVADVITADKFLSDNEFKMFPNPAREMLTLNFKSLSSGYINVVNALGQIVLKEQFNQSSFVHLNLSFDPGLYFIETYVNDKRVVKTLIKE